MSPRDVIARMYCAADDGGDADAIFASTAHAGDCRGEAFTCTFCQANLYWGYAIATLAALAAAGYEVREKMATREAQTDAFQPGQALKEPGTMELRRDQLLIQERAYAAAFTAAEGNHPVRAYYSDRLDETVDRIEAINREIYIRACGPTAYARHRKLMAEIDEIMAPYGGGYFARWVNLFDDAPRDEGVA